jgi:AGZA family xanthine/uracil permease-like MFS transporter
MCDFLKRYFKIEEQKSTIQQEIIAGITTFMTMAYIIFVNPSILQAAGLPFEATVITTALSAGILTIMMGVISNYPIALAAGMGFNAFITFGVVIGMNLSWQIAMGMVVIEGIVITLLVLTNIREAVMNAIPMNLKRAIGVGIGIFIVFIGLKNAGIVILNNSTIVSLGNFRDPGVLLAVIGLLFTSLLMAKDIKGSLLLGILVTTIMGFFFTLPNGKSITTFPNQIFTTFGVDSFSTIGQADILGALQLSYIPLIFAMLLTDFFDTMGTVVSIGSKGGYLDKEGKLPGLKKVLIIDSLAALVGGFFCASSNTSYIESASGVSAGGRTGFTSVVVGILFLLSIFFAPIISVVPTQAVAPVLIIIGFFMMSIVMEMDFNNFEEGFPAFLTLVTIPLTYSISNGIGIGFITYTMIKILNLKFKEVHPLMYITSIMFVIDFVIRKV